MLDRIHQYSMNLFLVWILSNAPCSNWNGKLAKITGLKNLDTGDCQKAWFLQNVLYPKFAIQPRVQSIDALQIKYIRNLRYEIAEKGTKNNPLLVSNIHKFIQNVFGTNDKQEIEYLCRNKYNYQFAVIPSVKYINSNTL